MLVSKPPAMQLANWRKHVLFTTITELALHIPGLIEWLIIEPDTTIPPFRWATHGARTQENAHPHHDHENRIAIVHNGVMPDILKPHLFNNLFAGNWKCHGAATRAWREIRSQVQVLNRRFNFDFNCNYDLNFCPDLKQTVKWLLSWSANM